jgi:hypothetical protein
MKETNQAKEVLAIKEKQKNIINCFKALSVNPDFKVYKEEVIDSKIKILRDALEGCSEKEFSKIQSALWAVRGIKDLFEISISREATIAQQIKELKDYLKT